MLVEADTKEPRWLETAIYSFVVGRYNGAGYYCICVPTIKTTYACMIEINNRSSEVINKRAKRK